MKKKFDQVGLAHSSGLKLTAGTDMIKDAAPYYQLQHEISAILNVTNLTTPFKVLPLSNKLNRVAKRTVDIAASVAFIMVVFPWLFPVIAILIKLSSPGPVFFLQKRNKRNGELFTCIKFRSMYKNADADILPATKNDKRITRIGRLLRNSYLDELPQFLNVLMGDMSLIGPRPHMISDNLKFDDLIKNYDLRHKVKPGITGLAQVMGYLGPTESLQEMEARVNLDIYYTRHWSPRIDIIILFRTILKTLGIK
ncbi:MAG: sugar transferase [Ferruginibacter sp.]|nr:sugar transferase [Ferruginibacter sp.]